MPHFSGEMPHLSGEIALHINIALPHRACIYYSQTTIYKQFKTMTS
jgi:hypothetical protein